MAALDILIVGGGPAGTAVAFRARELGLDALVIDYDDLMKRIRDYSKDKLILPAFGGGDKVCFPRGGDLVECLQFQPIDKDDMCAEWKALYEKHDIARRVGLELTGLEPLEDRYRAVTWDHNRRTEECFEARHVVLAIGRGVPRRFDIPGNTDGIAYRLADPEDYVGSPACVVGGGTSAAEAVIAISNAKSQAGDESSVYWSYRGDKMPRVSKSLAGEFFAAYVGNGNIRYFRKSEPAAISVGDDRREYLAVRVDRHQMAGRPNELTLLEFPKEMCLACIGEDIPEALLNSFGIHLATGGPRGRKRMVVNRCLETCRPNVYLIGDLLSQAYFETEDFDADPAGFREIKHRGNIKSALRDGVRVAQIIEQRLAGKEDVVVDIEDAEDTGSGVSIAAVSAPLGSSGPPRESLGEGRSETEAEAFVIRVLPTGVEEDEYPVRSHGITTIGSGDCDLSFPSDSMLAPCHGSVSHGEEGYFLRDDGSSTGVFLKIAPARKVELSSGDLLRVGRQFLVLQRENGVASLVHYSADGEERGQLALEPGRTWVLGRGNPDRVLDAGDKTLSRRHLAVSFEKGVVRVKDLKSVNGTFLRVRPARRLEHGDQIRLGQQLLTFSLRGEAALDPGIESRSASVGGAVEGGTEATPAPGPGQASVVFRGSGSDAPIPVAAGQSLCEAAEAAGVEITAECHSGICGSDPIRIVSGAEYLAGDAADQERETLEELCEVEPGSCRLACMTRINGPVVVELLSSD